VPEDVALLGLNDCAVHYMHVTSADSRTCHSDNDIVILDEFGFADLLYAATLVATS
jgi:3-deoxy-D-manno-octulosonic-acid transferase